MTSSIFGGALSPTSLFGNRMSENVREEELPKKPVPEPTQVALPAKTVYGEWAAIAVRSSEARSP